MKYWKDFLNYSKELSVAVELMKILKYYGYSFNHEVLLVGGLVRDMCIAIDNYEHQNNDDVLCGKERYSSFLEYLKGEKFKINDVDFATNIPIEKFEPHFDCIDIGKNKDFGILVIKYEDYVFEIANYRQESGYGDGRHPDSVIMIKDFEGDAKRRDFAINAMGIDVNGCIYDYFNGQSDIRIGCIDTVGNPDERFAEDYLRMLRAVRFSSKLQFGIEKRCIEAIQKNAHKIVNVSWERILKELNKMADLSGEQFANAIELMDLTGLLQYILPEISAMKSLKHNPKFHPEGGSTVYGHIIEALRCNKYEDVLLNWSILLHDVGKISCYSCKDGMYHYYKHHLEAKSLIGIIADRLKFSNELKECCQFVALNHMTLHDFRKVKKSKAMLLVNHKYWGVLLKASYCDSKSRGNIFDSCDWDKTEMYISGLNDWFKGKQGIDNIRKVVNGALIMKLRPEIKPSSIMGNIIKHTIDWIINENIDIEKNISDVHKFVKEFI